MKSPTSGAIDCDIHPALPNTKALLPYMDDYWREHMISRGIDLLDLSLTSIPPNAPINMREGSKPKTGYPGSDFNLLKEQSLDALDVRFAICNVLHGSMGLFSEDLSAALCRALNDWIAAELLDKDPRLRASIVVPMHNAEVAAEEIHRKAADGRFVQVLLLALAELPLGRRQNWPIFKAAQHENLPIGIHLGSTYRHAPTNIGWPAYRVEEYVNYSAGFAGVLNSLVSEGVFQEFSRLKVVLLESGVSWLTGWMWRADKTWRSMRREVPWLTEAPTELLRRHVRVSTQPFDAPPEAAQIDKVLELIGSDDMFLFSSDYPHRHYETDPVPTGFDGPRRQKLLVDNPMQTYSRLAEGVTP